MGRTAHSPRRTRLFLVLALALSALVLLAAAPAVARVVHRWQEEVPSADPGGQETAPSVAPAACGQQPHAEVDIETRPSLWLEVAATPEDRTRGLMFRESLPWDTGMLFVFEQPSVAGFWMRNTLIPLSIAWLDRDGTIVDIQDMQPLTDEVHAPAAPYVYAIETNQGWFEANGVGVGQRVLLCLEVTSP